MIGLDHTHDGSARSWLASANVEGADFPLQNLPLGVFRRAGEAQALRGGVAIGDQVLDLAALAEGGLVTAPLAAQALGAAARPALNDLFALGPASWRALRQALFALLESRADAATVASAQRCLVPQALAEMSLPARIGNYTDFYTSYHHAHNIGRLFSAAHDVVPANFHSIPIAYHGRASSVVVSGTPVRRPLGQMLPPGAAAPVFGPCARLDYEFELGAWVGVGNALGTPVPLREAEGHLFGISLLNDWSARDIQGWEMQPLGPFQAKNFATSVSPWIVTMDALIPFRLPWTRDSRWPQPLPYLDAPANREQGAIDILLETWLESPARRNCNAGPVRIAATSFRHQHWTLAQMLAHHTVGGCNLQAGDLLGSGTISGPEADEAGAMMELTQAGRAPLRLPDGRGGTDERAFLADGDALILRGHCERPGFARIGFGECCGEIVPALPPSAAGG